MKLFALSLLALTITVTGLGQAHAKSYDLVADLSCKGKNTDGEKVNVRISSVYDTVTIEGKTFEITKQKEKNGEIRLEAQKKSNELEVRLSEDLKEFELRSKKFGKVSGKCKDSLETSNGGSDDAFTTDVPSSLIDRSDIEGGGD